MSLANVCAVMRNMNGKTNAIAGRMVFDARKANQISSDEVRQIEGYMTAVGCDPYGAAGCVIHWNWGATVCSNNGYPAAPIVFAWVERGSYKFEAKNQHEKNLLEDFLGIKPPGKTIDAFLGELDETQLREWHTYWSNIWVGIGRSDMLSFTGKKLDEYVALLPVPPVEPITPPEPPTPPDIPTVVHFVSWEGEIFIPPVNEGAILTMLTDVELENYHNKILITRTFTVRKGSNKVEATFKIRRNLAGTMELITHEGEIFTPNFTEGTILTFLTDDQLNILEGVTPPIVYAWVERGPYKLRADNQTQKDLLEDFLGIDPPGDDIDTYLGRLNKTELGEWKTYWDSEFDKVGRPEFKQTVLGKYNQYIAAAPEPPEPPKIIGLRSRLQQNQKTFLR